MLALIVIMLLYYRTKSEKSTYFLLLRKIVMNHINAAPSILPPYPYFILYRGVQNKKRPPDLHALFVALSDFTRRTIFEYLCYKEAQIKDLCIYTSNNYQAIRKHLNILEQYGLITSYKDGKYRYYHAQSHALNNLHIWLTAKQAALLRLN